MKRRSQTYLLLQRKVRAQLQKLTKKSLSRIQESLQCTDTVKADVSLVCDKLVDSVLDVDSGFPQNLCQSSLDDEWEDVLDMDIGVVGDSNENESSSESSSSDEDGQLFCDSDCSTCSEFDTIMDCGEPETVCPSHSEEVTGEESMSDKLREWAVGNQVTLVAIKDMLQILKPSFPDLPVDPKTLLRTGKRVAVEKMGDGEYYNFGLKTSLSLRIRSLAIKPSKILLNFNVDDIPIFKSSTGKLTPILGWIADSDTVPFVCAAYYGPSKPNIQIFFKDFAPELDELLDNGIEVDGQIYDVEVNCFVCDLPAKAYVRGTVGHGGYFSCERCVQRGKWEGRMTFPEMDAAPRTDESFLMYDDPNHHNAESPLTDIGIRMVTQFPLDYLHLILLGVMRKLLFRLTKRKRHFKFSKANIVQASKLLEAIAKTWPSDFNRRPRSLSCLKRWKGTELRHFLLYLGTVVLKRYLPTHVYNHFLLLHVAITILVRKDLHQSWLPVARQLLRQFVSKAKCRELYGRTILHYNFHALLHLADDVERYGNVDRWSAFIFENELQRLKRMVRGKTKPLQQVVNRVVSREEKGVEVIVSPPDGLVASSIKKTAGPAAGLLNVKHFSRYILNGRQLSLREGDNVVMLNDSSVVVISNFVQNEEGIWAIGKRFNQYTDLYKEPIKSSQLGIYAVEGLSGLPRKYSASKFMTKCVAVPFGHRSSYAIYPLIN